MEQHFSEKLFNIVKDALGVELSDIKPDLQYQSIPEWDSVAHMTLISSLEHEFDVTFTDEDISQINSIEKIQKFLKEHTKSSN